MIDSPRPHLFLKEGDHDTTRRDNFTRIVRGARPSVQALLGGARGRSPPTSAVMHRSNTVTPLWGDKLAESSHARNDATAYAATPLRGTTRRLVGQQKGGLQSLFFFFLNHSLAGRACTARTPAASPKGGCDSPRHTSFKKRGTMTPRAGITLPALSVAPGPVHKGSWEGQEPSTPQ